MRVPARGIPVASEEPPPAAAFQDDEGPLSALVAGPDVVLLLQGGLDFLADRGLVLLEDLDDLFEHPLGFGDDLGPRADAAGDLLHVLLEVGGHLRPRDLLGMVLEGADEGLPAPRGSEHLSFDVLPIVQLLDDLVAGGLRAEAQLLHLLDQVPLGVPRRGAGLILLDRDVEQRDALADHKGGQDGFPHGPVRIVLPPAGVLDNEERLAAGVEFRVGCFDEAARRYGREEPASDELEDPPVVLPLQIGLLRAAGRIDRRVVRRLHGAAAGADLLLGEEFLRLCREVAFLESLEDSLQTQRRRVHRVVRSRIANPSGLVQGLSDSHRLGRAVAEAVRLRDEGCRVERRRRPLLPLVPGVLEDLPNLRGEGPPPGGLRLRLDPEPALLVGPSERRPRLVERRSDGPEVLRDERLDLQLAVHDEGERGALHAADGKEVLPELLGRDGDEAGKGCPPREVDELA